MANQPKPAPKPEPKPAPKPGQPPASQPNQPHPGQDNPNPQRRAGEHEHGEHERDKQGDRQSDHGERELTDDDTGLLHDERNDPGPEHDRGRDWRTGEIPGTPYTAPEGHDHREPGPGEPGGPGRAGADLAPPPRTIADEQRERSDRYATQGVEHVKSAHDEREPGDRAANTKQVPGVSPTAGVTPGEPGATRRTP
jgi:hypothetical protein